MNKLCMVIIKKSFLSTILNIGYISPKGKQFECKWNGICKMIFSIDRKAVSAACINLKITLLEVSYELLQWLSTLARYKS